MIVLYEWNMGLSLQQSSSLLGFETNIFVSKLIEKLSEKKHIMQSKVANYVRTKVSFELIRSQVRCIRGSRSLKKVRIDTGEMEMVAEQMNIRE